MCTAHWRERAPEAFVKLYHQHFKGRRNNPDATLAEFLKNGLDQNGVEVLQRHSRWVNHWREKETDQKYIPDLINYLRGYADDDPPTESNEDRQVCDGCGNTTPFMQGHEPDETGLCLKCRERRSPKSSAAPESVGSWIIAAKGAVD